MLQKLTGLGNAFKKMAQRSMLRGNRGDAEAIHNFGIAGFRSNMKEGGQDVKKDTANTGTQNILHKDFQNKEVNTNLGTNILDSVNK